ncbi:sulfur carrier protein [Nocardioides zeae]|uniref:Sulfur carrier protein n=1 Tax=Nocardioides zeae TaxID=1457234 RepID=A0ACC6ID93_9ACTN|nr:sulfur carrier protein ThiS [Nocardioides zeae]MDR6175803.1 sulfur carrier protein [Nocardioides zeae]MDR6208731.1 sulfur carrier protein [Nocardioides zeae]
MPLLALNGEPTPTDATTVAALVAATVGDPAGHAVALNGVVVRRADHHDTPLADGDVVEIVTAVQGG